MDKFDKNRFPTLLITKNRKVTFGPNLDEFGGIWTNLEEFGFKI